MKGHLISYVSDKKYGFIKGEDGHKYFFHISSLKNKEDESKIVKGTDIEFVPNQTKKGLSAKNIVIPTAYFKKEILDFFITKNSKPKYGKVESYKTIQTKFFKDLNQSKKHLEDSAKSAGANAVLNIKYKKETFSHGNYKYSVHGFEADIAIVTGLKKCSSKEEQINAENQLKSRINMFENKSDFIKRTEHKHVEKQLDSQKFNPLFFIIFCLFIVFLFIING